MTTIELNDNQSDKTNFKGVFGPLEDEIHIRRYLEKYRHITTFKGAFKQVFKYLFYQYASAEKMDLSHKKI